MSDFPYFPLYPTDLLGDDKVIVQDLESFGAFMRLLCIAWQRIPPATIPSDDAVIAKLLGITAADWSRLKPSVIPCWQLRGGLYHNKRLSVIHADMIAKRQKRVQAGRLGGKQCLSNARALVEHTGSGNGYGSGSLPEASILPPNPTPFTLEAFAAAAKNVRCSDAERDKCWAYYDSQGWHKANGRAITGDPRSIITSWLANPQKAPAGASGAAATPSGKRQAWQVEKDIESAKSARAKLWTGIESACAGRGYTTDEVFKHWRKHVDANIMMLYDRIKSRLKELETELTNSL